MNIFNLIQLVALTGTTETSIHKRSGKIRESKEDEKVSQDNINIEHDKKNPSSDEIKKAAYIVFKGFLIITIVLIVIYYIFKKLLYSIIRLITN
jgi:hypothetical protein